MTQTTPQTVTRIDKPRREYLAGLVDSLLLIVARVGANVLALVWTMLLVRLVQPSLSGIAFQAIAMAQLFSILLTLNVESGAVRTLVPAMREGRLDQAAGFIRFNRRIMLFSVPFLAMLALLWHGLFAAPELSVRVILFVALGAIMVALARMTSRHATALGVMRKGLLPRLLMGPIVMTVGLGIVWLADWRLQPWHVAALYALSEALTVTVQHYLLRNDLGRFKDQPANTEGWRNWLSLGLWLSPGLMMSEYRKALLIAASAIVLLPAQLSLFAIAFSIINIVNFGVVAVDVAFSPRIAHAMAGDDGARRDRLLAVSSAIKLAGLSLGGGLLLGLGHWILGWFGADYLAAWPAMMVLLLLPAGSILFGPASIVLSSRGQGRLDFTGNVIGATATILAVTLGGVMGDLTGAAVGAVIGHLVNLAIMAWLCRSRLGVDTTLLSLRHLRAASTNSGAPA
ncbi:lipopolysaccharide biosynthesis protein [Paracoccus tegillarcae]|uniref:lipopolysaccharide biosynthesis protein n=1 Tax=Paracoccus tegillarcae TaxID=1529068 RepID=UPI0013005F3F|nr:hypothetical protein [Paracoccus tegillarcae]